MATQTLGMVKPDAHQHAGMILKIAEGHGFRVANQRTLVLKPDAVCIFYAEHQGKPWFEELVAHMASGPVTIVALECEEDDAVPRWRALIGSTDPSKAEPDTIRWMFGREQTGPRNVVHGSDSNESADREIKFFFAGIRFGI